MKGQRKCRNCGEVFTKAQPLQQVCGYKCAAQYAAKERAKKVEKDWQVKRKKMLPTAHAKKYKAQFQSEINKLARLIDLKFGHTTCIDCGRFFLPNRQQHGAHFTSVGSNHSIRFNLHNIHSATSDCNKYSDKHHEGYRLGLVLRYGDDYLSKVEGLPQRYPSIHLSEIEIVEKLKICRKLIRTLPTIFAADAIKMRELLNHFLGIYK